MGVVKVECWGGGCGSVGGRKGVGTVFYLGEVRR